MRYYKAVTMKQYMLMFCSGLLLFSVSVVQAPLRAEDELNVKREKDTTVYTIGSNGEKKREEAAERDKAWDMLRNMPVFIDGRQGLPPHPAAPPVVQPPAR